MRKILKRIIFTFTLVLSIFMLSGCDFSKFTIVKYNRNTKITTQTDTPDVYEKSILGNFIYENAYTYKDVYKKLSNGGNAYMPSTGDVKVLVVPIEFSNVYTSKKTKEKYVNDLNRVFFGDDTGYESVSSYYEKSSYGKLKISGTITDWYTPKKDSTYYEAAYDSNKINPAISDLLTEVLEYFDSKIDYSEYDSDNDGVIDAVYLVCNKAKPKHGSLYWSWMSASNSNKKFDEKSAYQYMWSNIGFIYEDDFRNPIRGDYVNAITYIHETGHLMGADDYYDYSENEYKTSIFGTSLSEEGKGCNYGAGGYNMMDSNVLDHCAVTKMLLGWINPYVVTQNATIEINKFNSSGDAIIVSPTFDEERGNLSEFFIIEYFDNTGLNRQSMFDNRGFKTSGIIIYHVNAKVIADGDYWSLFRYDNSYTDRAFLTLINARTNKLGKTDFIDSSEDANDLALFKELDVFVPIDDYEYADKSLLNVSIKVNSLGETANITINFKEEA